MYVLLPILLLLLGAPLLAAASPQIMVPTPVAMTGDSPAVLTAQQFRYDEQTKIAYAAGEVELVQGQQRLRAQQLSFDRARNVVKAEGQVSLTDLSTNQTLFAERVEVTGDLKNGFISRIGALLSDNSRIVAQEAERIEDGRYTVLRNATYSPCDLCQDNPESPPIWQLKAVRVTKDDVERDIIYRDAWLELAGIPIFYTPYFSHPDPSVQRRRGFVGPNAGQDSNLGEYASFSYYYFFNPSSDLTITPTFSVKDGLQLAIEQRQSLRHASWRWRGSFVNADRVTDDQIETRDQWRGHFFGNANYDLNSRIRMGADVAFASDKSYLYRYRIPTKDVLINRAYTEYFGPRDYGNASLIYFQDIRPGDRAIAPFVTPALSWQSLGAPAQMAGGHWFVDSSFIHLTRDQGALPTTRSGPNSFRLANQFGWQRRDEWNSGLVSSFAAQQRLDVFWADQLSKPNGTGQFNDVYGTRFLPIAEVQLSYPLGRPYGSWQHVIEPVVSVTAMPRLSPDPRMANEDSVDVEFDHTNLFMTNRYAGLDRLETGTRISTGVRSGWYGPENEQIEFSFGRSYRFFADDNFPENVGLSPKWSDYVGLLNIQPRDWINLIYAFRLSNGFSPRRTEIFSSFGRPWLRPFVNYISSDQRDTANADRNIAEISYGFSSKVWRYYVWGLNQRRALEPEAGLRKTTAFIGYSDECLTTQFEYSRDATSRADLRAGQSFMINVVFKNLGTVQTGALNPFGSNADREVQQP